MSGASGSKPPRIDVDREALVAAMAVAPGVYSRNRMFGFFRDPEVRRARARATALRAIVRQIALAPAELQGLSMERARAESGRRTLRYRVARLHLDRAVELTDLEAACVVYLCARAGVDGVSATAEERATIDAALRRLGPTLDLGVVEDAARLRTAEHAPGAGR